MSNKFEWKCQYAIREKSKDRSKGGIIIGIRKEIAQEVDSTEIESVNGIQERRLRIDGKYGE